MRNAGNHETVRGDLKEPRERVIRPKFRFALALVVIDDALNAFAKRDSIYRLGDLDCGHGMHEYNVHVPR